MTLSDDEIQTFDHRSRRTGEVWRTVYDPTAPEAWVRARLYEPRHGAPYIAGWRAYCRRRHRANESDHVYR